ncbi:MAG: carbohydrate ABC transporter permease [Dictyoglomus thermophilum]|uniref:Carbohydrate ABC transporter permease n=1 Tax=Dictyoglomus thermophilum TaxID=14 RepID=A0A7V3ZJ30_DICTH|nr:carbohydrate ABC transporter permease [Dictyoglomus thermophilum]MCX7720498.1 carbohydrate ABC transporter permease [Dictyoglomus thermophilum]
MKYLLYSVKWLILLVILVFFLFPVYWLVITAFKPASDWFTWPPMIFPRTLTLENFTGGGSFYGSTTTSIENITPYLRNSTVISLITSILAVIISALAAYSISRFKTGGRKFANWIISIRMLPPIASALPLYILFKNLRLLDTWTALIMVYLIFTIPFSTWVLISFFNGIPKELDEAAYIDGASSLSTFFHVVLPLSAPGLAAMMTLSFVTCWGEFLLALILTSTANSQTLPVYLGRYITGWRIAWGPLAAAGIVTMLPAVIFSFTMQRYLLRGLTFGAVKY